jgi:hypothetical protein
MSFDDITPMSQVPIDTGFGPANTAADVIAGIDLRGKIALVTGGYSGLGLGTRTRDDKKPSYCGCNCDCRS